MARLLPATALLAAITMAASPESGEAKHSVPVYYPTKIGTRWVYGVGEREVSVEVTKVEDANGAKVVTARRVEDGKPGRVWEVVRITKDGLFVTDDGEIVCDPARCVLRSPVKAREQWAEDFRFGNRRCVGKRTVGVAEEVEVPAGRFTAVPVTSEYRLQDVGDVRDVSWYAEGVGEVKSGIKPGRERVLKSFTEGK